MISKDPIPASCCEARHGRPGIPMPQFTPDSPKTLMRTEPVSAAQREARYGHPGSVIWLTGLSAAGKSTIASALERELFDRDQHVYVLDGDTIRNGLCSDLGFSPEDRSENIRRAGRMAMLFADAGLICVTAFISPYRADRDRARRLVKPGRFIEVFVNAPLEICEQRDPKGLYALARAKKISQFSGISAPYEAPVAPEIELRTDQMTIEECVQTILEYLHRHKVYPYNFSI